MKSLDFAVGDSFYAVLRGGPNPSGAIFIKSANSFAVKTALFADCDNLISPLDQNAAVIGADPEFSGAAVKNGIDRLVFWAVRRIQVERGKLDAVEGSHSFGGADHEQATRRLRDGADVTLGQSVFDVPFLFLILGECDWPLPYLRQCNCRKKEKHAKRSWLAKIHRLTCRSVSGEPTAPLEGSISACGNRITYDNTREDQNFLARGTKSSPLCDLNCMRYA